MNDKRSIKSLGNMIETNAVVVGQQNKREAHNLAIRKSLKEYYNSPAGIAERNARSERTKLYWASPEGQAKKERLRQKYKGVKKS
jgi:hypothetical protein